MRVLLFGRLAELAGWRSRELAGPASVAALRERLAEEDAALGAALAERSVKVAVNQVMRHADAELAAGDEVAFMPPLSGG